MTRKVTRWAAIAIIVTMAIGIPSVAKAENTSTTQLSSSSVTSRATEPITFTAVVEAGGTGIDEIPTGNVIFKDGSAILATVALALVDVGYSSYADFTTSALSVGTHTITAEYEGDSNSSGTWDRRLALKE